MAVRTAGIDRNEEITSLSTVGAAASARVDCHDDERQWSDSSGGWTSTNSGMQSSRDTNTSSRSVVIVPVSTVQSNDVLQTEACKSWPELARASRRHVISPPGIAMPPAGLCSTDVTFVPFWMSPCHSTTVGRIATQVVALTLSMKKYHRQQIWWTLVQQLMRYCGSFAWVVNAGRLKYAVRWF